MVLASILICCCQLWFLVAAPSLPNIVSLDNSHDLPCDRNLVYLVIVVAIISGSVQVSENPASVAAAKIDGSNTGINTIFVSISIITPCHWHRSW